MSKNPIINALAATAYVVLVSLVMFYGPKIANVAEKEDTFFAPIALISLFTLSAGVMGYIFLTRPIQLFLEGQKKEGISLFAKTLLSFAVITVILLVITFSGII